MLKLDDDCFFSVPRLMEVATVHGSDIVGGFPVLNARRKKQGKNRVPDYLYRRNRYPPFMAGPGYLLDRRAGDCILKAGTFVFIVSRA